MRAAACLLILLAVFPLAGCGQKDTTAMNHKFERLEFKISALETINSMYNQQHFADLTQKYIALVHQYEGTLGKDEARRRLTQLGDELNTYCLACTGVLYTEAKNL